MILFPFLDQEILDLAGWYERNMIGDVIDSVEEDLKLTVFIAPVEEYLVIPPTYYLESPLCRVVLRRTLAFIDEGYVRLLMRESDFYTFKAKKQASYKKVQHVEKYYRAYFTTHDYELELLPWRIARKPGRTGQLSLQCWRSACSRRAAVGGGAVQGMFGELERRVLETEQDAFLWESVERHIDTVGLGVRDTAFLGIRELMTRSYIVAQRHQGIIIPGDASLVVDVCDVGRSREYSLFTWRTLMELCGLQRVLHLPASEIVLIKKSEATLAVVMDRIRGYLRDNMSVERIVDVLAKSGDLVALQRIVRVRGDKKRGNQMRKEEKFVTDHPGRTVFVMMRFSDAADRTGALLAGVYETIREVLACYGCEAVRADEKDYSETGELWENVCVYLRACSYGVALLENLYDEEMNPNIAVEFGYMAGLRKRVLLLKEKGFTRIRADLLGKLWKEYEIVNLETVADAIMRWMIDLGIPQTKPYSPTPRLVRPAKTAGRGRGRQRS